MESTAVNSVPGVADERRKRARLRLEFPVTLIRAAASEEIHGTTVNVSGDGFYCVVPRTAPTGERLGGILSLGSACAKTIQLFCSLRVVRAEVRRDGFGVACQIERYSVRAG